MAETSQRYIVRELTGYVGVNRDATTSLEQRRLQAQAVAHRFEYEHRRWLAEAS